VRGGGGGDAAAPGHLGRSERLRRAVEASRSTELADWPPAAHGAFLAEIEHLRRIVELLPSLDQYLTQMILPRGPSPAADKPANPDTR
jgi:hypothetical protein